MSPSQFHAKKEITSTTTSTNGLLPPHLKINRESHLIKKSPSTPSPPLTASSLASSSSLINSSMTQVMPASSYKQPQQRHPVIIYTHSPKIIHTQPKDFMALVQKLTGLSHSEEDEDGDNKLLLQQQQLKQEPEDSCIAALVGDNKLESDRKNVVIVRNEDETSSVITEENNCSSSMGENQVNSCFMAGEPRLNPYMTNLPVLVPSSGEFVCSSQPLLNYSDTFFFSHNMRTSINIPSSATLEGMKEFHDH